MLRVCHSNRLEVLLDALARRLVDVDGGAGSGTAPDPFEPELIVVPNQGMARWLSQQLALRTGVSANLEFPLPATFFWRVLTAWLPDAPDQQVYQRDALAWRIFRLLPGLLGEPAFAELRRYLDSDDAQLRRFELASELAGLFDQYLVYRHDLCLAFEAGAADDDWQATLWRALSGEVGSAHRARLVADFAVAAGGGPPSAGALPDRLSLFAVGGLAPVQVEMLGALAEHREVGLYYLNPCREYWADVEGERHQARRRARASRAGLPDPTGLLDIGNPLLASFGHAGQVFLDQLLELGGEHDDRFVDPREASLLAHLQRDILELADRRTPDPDARTALAAGDRSLLVHGTHGPLREVQVLHDRLLDLFETLPGLEPKDILVMAPDMEAYAPYVAAVFGTAEDGMRIPWSVADRTPAAGQSLAEAIGTLMALPRSRLAVTEVLSLLAVPAVARRFAVSAAARERITGWVVDSGVRWGLDQHARGDLGLPAERQNSWAFGLDRLFLGYAMPPEWADQPCGPVLAYPDLDPGEADLLGALQALIDALADWRERLAVPRTAAQWAEQLNGLLEAFFALEDDAEIDLVETLREAIAGTVDSQRIAAVDEPIGIDLVRSIVGAAIKEPAGAHGFLTGRTTFCNMVPMRSIPHRVIAILGMNGDAFPRAQRPSSFDRIQREPRRGDRSRRRDDRYLFLECLLAARDAVHISWTARDARDNGVRVRSPVVDELLDYLDAAFCLPGSDLSSDRPSDLLVVEYPLQPFGSTQFDGADPRLASHSARWCAAARALGAAADQPFCGAPLAPPDPALRVVAVADLLRFLRDPAGWFLAARLGLRLPRLDDAPLDSEPFVVEAGLERYRLRDTLLDLRDGGQRDAATLAVVRAAGRLPHGALGEQVAAAQLTEVDALLGRLANYRGEPVAPVELDLALGPFRLQGELRGLGDSGLVFARPTDLKPKDRLAAWVWHLLLCALAPPGVQPRTVQVGTDQTLELGAVERPAEPLADLLDLYWDGLSRPIPFFPDSSYAWFDRRSMAEVDKQWHGSGAWPGERDALAVRMAFRGTEPLGSEFRAIAERVYRPLHAVAQLHKAGQEP